MKAQKVYFVATGLLSLMMLMGAINYIFNNGMVREAFITMGYPIFLIYPLAAAKLAAVGAIWQRKAPVLRQWAYAGLAYVFTLAFVTHLVAGDGQFPGALVAGIILATSYGADRLCQ